MVLRLDEEAAGLFLRIFDPGARVATHSGESFGWVRGMREEVERRGWLGM